MPNLDGPPLPVLSFEGPSGVAVHYQVKAFASGLSEGKRKGTTGWEETWEDAGD
jgi:hypothetical protein